MNGVCLLCVRSLLDEWAKLHKMERENTEWAVIANAVRMSEVLNEWLLN